MRGRSPVFVPTHPIRRAATPALASAGQSVTIPLVNGPFQNNGATQWFGNLALGTPGQTLKIAIDTGGNFIWTTSSLCAPTSCQHYGNGRFIYQDSSTFQWVDQTPITVSFGPWGSMVVQTGRDDIAFGASEPLDLTMFLSQSYSGSQFEQLDWDGGIGMASGSDYNDPRSSYFPAELMNAGLWDPELPIVSFVTDQASGQGSVTFGGIDLDAVDLTSAVFLPWTPYTADPGELCLWTTALYQYRVGNTVVAVNKQFCLDSGSSQFKGDPPVMEATLRLINTSPQPDVSLFLGISLDGTPAEIVVPPSVYNVEIQAGPDQGQVIPQFAPLALPELVLVGSLLMDQMYCTFVYDVTETTAGYHLSPVGVWIFNKKNGPQLIKTSGSSSAAPFTMPRRRPHRFAGLGK